MDVPVLTEYMIMRSIIESVLDQNVVSGTYYDILQTSPCLLNPVRLRWRTCMSIDASSKSPTKDTKPAATAI